MNPLTAAVHWLERQRGLDGVAVPVRDLVARVTSPEPVGDLLGGRWLGHPVHPLLVHVPLGGWVMAAVVDHLGGPGSEDAADLLVLTGIVGYVPAAATGAHDWSSTRGGATRVGLAHAGLNAVGLALHIGSLAARRSGARPVGIALSTVGLGAVGVAGYLGGHLAYVNAVGVHGTGERHVSEGPAQEVEIRVRS
ncbi:DUF2231 domain-containing protein [Kytococcus sedentarius]|uniref:DUF2231 domain-containing protein n=1 Tax=Kytococcus sedentarius TaxID=1276 RepID=UPI0035BBD8C5